MELIDARFVDVSAFLIVTLAPHGACHPLCLGRRETASPRGSLTRS